MKFLFPICILFACLSLKVKGFCLIVQGPAKLQCLPGVRREKRRSAKGMSSDKKKESTIYTHYGTIPTSERRDHKAAQARVSFINIFPTALQIWHLTGRPLTRSFSPQARACHHFFLRHEACVNRHLRFGKASVVSSFTTLRTVRCA